jgi:hypothetical protein
LFRVADNTQVWTTDAHGLAAIDKSTESITDQIASLLTHRQ